MKSLVSVLVGQHLAASKSDARRLVTQGAITVNGKVATAPDMTVADTATVKRTRRAKWGEDSLAGEEERELSGKFAKSIRCDCCSRPMGRLGSSNHFTDDEVCRGSDGPGFFLCWRSDCSCRYEGKSVEERKVIFAEGRQKNDSLRRRAARNEKPAKPAPPWRASTGQLMRVLDAYPVGGPVSDLIGLGMIANLLGVSEEQALVAAQQLVNFGRFTRIADNAWRRTM